jgi:O-antigen/teichoic acid export membrane protein
MALKTHLALMSITTVSRIAVGLLTFSVVARFLGPEAFGVLMFWMSVATLLSLMVNYGMTPYILKEIGTSPQSTENLLNESLTAKLLLAACLLIIVAVTSVAVADSHRGVLLYLLVAAISDSFVEFFGAGFRARSKFAIETRIATATAFSHAAIVAGVVAIYPTPLAAALAYACSRILVLSITAILISRYVSPLRLAPIGQALQRLRHSAAYAIDFGFQSLFGQIDSVVLNHFIGTAAVGLYQAGMRVFQGGVSAAQVLANVFLPRAASYSADTDAFARECVRVQAAFVAVGTAFGLTLAIFSDVIVGVLFGSAYAELGRYFPLFGMLFFVRFAAAAWGVVLTAAGEQKYRTYATIFHWAIVAVMVPFLVPESGIAGWLISLIVANIVLACLYALRGARRVARPGLTILATSLCAAVFVPLVWSGR